MKHAANPQLLTSSRNSAIDLARFIGAFGIVWFHVKAPGASIGYAALQLFTILTVYFSLKTYANYPLNDFIYSKFKRLVVPWIIWSGIFAAAKVAELYLSGGAVSDEFKLWMLLTGPALHLWFLPYIFIACVAVIVADKWARNIKGKAWIVVASCVFNAAFILLLNTYDFPVPFAQWLHVLPATFMGWALFRLEASRGDYFALGLGLVMVCSVFLLRGQYDLSQQILIGGILSMLVLKIHCKERPFISMLGSISLGVYLVHPAVFSLYQRAIQTPEYVTAILVAALSTLLCFLITKFKVGKILF